MAKVVLDLRNYKDRQGGRVPKGTYTVVIEDIEAGPNSNKDLMFTVFLRVSGGPEDGTTLVDRLTASEKAMFRVVAFLNAMGVKTPNKQINVDTAKLIGRRVQVSVEDGEPFRGTIRSEVQSYISQPRSAEPETDLDDIGGLDDLAGIADAAETPAEAAPVAEAAPSAPEAAETPAPEAEDVPETVDNDELDLDGIQL